MLKKLVWFVLPLLLLSACASRLSAPVTELTVEMVDFSYRPSAVSIPAGQPVTLTISNTGNIEHDFVIERIEATTKVIEDHGSGAHHAHGQEQSYDLHISALPGQSSVVEVTAAESGTYRVFCSVDGHEEAGMIGELIVIDPD